MKIDISSSCFQCYEEDDLLNVKSPIPHVELYELNYDNIYLQRCKRGHLQYTIVELRLFQVLYDLGFLSLLDGYPREAVSNFATSLERFYEFIIEVIFLDRKISDDLILKSWDKIKKSSERQIGAFVSLFTHHLQYTPAMPTNSMMEFRNNIVHKGDIPSTKEAQKYGQDIFNLIHNNLITLKDIYGDNLKNVFYSQSLFRTRNMKRKYSELTDKNSKYMHGPSIINLNKYMVGKCEKIDLDKLFNEYLKTKKPFRMSYTNVL